LRYTQFSTESVSYYLKVFLFGSPEHLHKLNFKDLFLLIVNNLITPSSPCQAFLSPFRKKISVLASSDSYITQPPAQNVNYLLLHSHILLPLLSIPFFIFLYNLFITP